MHDKNISELKSAYERGEPLVSFTIFFAQDSNPVEAVNILNSQGDDIFIFEKPWYNDFYLRLGRATKPALERVFGWIVLRKQSHLGDIYYWETDIEPQYFPRGLENSIQDIGLSQPDAGDDGQFYEWD